MDLNSLVSTPSDPEEPPSVFELESLFSTGTLWFLAFFFLYASCISYMFKTSLEQKEKYKKNQ